MNLTPEQLAELKALAEAATPGPWWSSVCNPADGHALAWIGNAFVECDGGRTSYAAPSRDAEFIAAAREAIPALIADLEESNARIADLENGHTNVDAEYARQFDTNAAVESSKAQRELAATRKQLEEAQAKLAAAEKNAARWKERAEFEYSKHMYPDNPGLAVGAIDAHMRAGWTWIGKQEAIDAAIAAQEAKSHE